MSTFQEAIKSKIKPSVKNSVETLLAADAATLSPGDAKVAARLRQLAALQEQVLLVSHSTCPVGWKVSSTLPPGAPVRFTLPADAKHKKERFCLDPEWEYEPKKKQKKVSAAKTQENYDIVQSILGDKTEKQAAHERIKARDAAKEMYKQQNPIDKEAALKVAQDKRAKKFKKALKKAGVTKQDGDAIASASSDFLKDPTTGDPVPADEKGKKKIPRRLSEALLNATSRRRQKAIAKAYKDFKHKANTFGDLF